MSVARGPAVVATLVYTVAISGCGSRSMRQTGEDSAVVSHSTIEDSLVGLVEEVGAEPATMLQLTTENGSRHFLEGDQRPLLRSVQGVTAAVFGFTERPGAFTVQRFEVRAANGVRAVDGVLAERDGALELVRVNGERIAVPGASPELRRAVGQRVWMSGDLSRGPDAYGIIERRP